MSKRSLILLAVLAGAACRATEAAEPTPPATAAAPTEAAEAAEPTLPATTAAPNEEPAGAGEVTIKDAADYEARGLEMVDAFANAFTSAGADCDKAAANMTAFIAEYGSTFEAIARFEDAYPDAKAAMDEKLERKGEELVATLAPIMMACMDHPGLKAAMEKVPL